MLKAKLEAAERLFDKIQLNHPIDNQEIAHLMKSEFDWADLGKYLSKGFESPAQAIRDACGKKEIPNLSQSVTSPSYVTVDLKDYDNLEVSFPINWSYNGGRDRRWRREFCSLMWARPYSNSNDFESMNAVVLQHCNDFVGRKLPPDMAWDEHCLADRSESLAYYLHRLVENGSNVPEPLALACLRCIILQLLLMADERFYSPGHNHGFMQDLSIITVASMFPGFIHSKYMISLAQKRIVDRQLLKSIAKDGAHKENSPEYHLHFIKLTNKVIAHPFIDDSTKERVNLIKNAALENLIYFVQPDYSLAAFGDTHRFDVRTQLKKISLKSGLSSNASLEGQYKDFLGGANNQDWGRMDALFSSVGYASFRTRWQFGETPYKAAGATCMFIKSGFKSIIHKHDDDSSFQLFGLGRELIVDPGKFSNDKSLDEGRIGASSAGHAVFRFDNEDVTNGDLRSNILNNYMLSSELCYVIGSRHFEKCSRTPHVYRVFLFLKPFDVVVADIFWSRKNGIRCRSQIPFHPDLVKRPTSGSISRFTMLVDGSRVLSVEVLPVTGAHSPATEEDESIVRWRNSLYFPTEGQSRPMNVADILYQAARGVNVVAYHVSIARPDQKAKSFSSIELNFRNGTFFVDTEKHNIAIPILQKRLG